jgi:hypothetical protein
LPPISEIHSVTHDETRGCLFDMCGIEKKIFHSCDNPQICDECVNKLNQGRVSITVIINTKAELKKIRKPLFNRLFDFVKMHPIWSLIISSIFAIILGIISSLLANLLQKIFEKSA